MLAPHWAIHQWENLPAKPVLTGKTGSRNHINDLETQKVKKEVTSLIETRRFQNGYKHFSDNYKTSTNRIRIC